jgi:hypothetical protein
MDVRFAAWSTVNGSSDLPKIMQQRALRKAWTLILKISCWIIYPDMRDWDPESICQSQKRFHPTPEPESLRRSRPLNPITELNFTGGKGENGEGTVCVFHMAARKHPSTWFSSRSASAASASSCSSVPEFRV